jgi:hypothetical protein
MKRGLVPALVSVLLAGVAGVALAARDVDELLGIAASHAESPEGAEYVPKLEESFAAQSRSGVGGCVNSHGGWSAGTTSFRVVVRIGEGGQVELVEIDPERPPTSCLKAVVSALTLPAPPFTPFYAVLWAKRPEPG